MNGVVPDTVQFHPQNGKRLSIRIRTHVDDAHIRGDIADVLGGDDGDAAILDDIAIFFQRPDHKGGSTHRGGFPCAVKRVFLDLIILGSPGIAVHYEAAYIGVFGGKVKKVAVDHLLKGRDGDFVFPHKPRDGFQRCLLPVQIPRHRLQVDLRRDGSREGWDQLEESREEYRDQPGGHPASPPSPGWSRFGVRPFGG
ncbi:hypothetical protein AB0395_18555 [Streptosporangium sp. NPDC051023]|uniref:hypothetical protein n=1 Tax=Streptosporangium sp. NPDC051023 TaxID=3155410 RepID=UPI00344C77E8